MRSRERYAERMGVPWWGWPFAALVGIGLASFVYMGSAEWWRMAPLLIAPVATVSGLWWLSRLPVRVVEADDGLWLHVDDAKLPLSAVADVEVLRATAYSDALGVALHPLAFVVQRPWIRRGVRIVLDDPDDPTPYWVVSSRNPERLREALTANQAQSLQIG